MVSLVMQSKAESPLDLTQELQVHQEAGPRTEQPIITDRHMSLLSRVCLHF